MSVEVRPSKDVLRADASARAAHDRDTLRRAVAWLGHAPGLWLCYREPLPRPLRRPNVVAVLGTLAAVTTAVLLAPHDGAALAALLTWATGHVAWGSYLAWHLPSSQPSNTGEEGL